MFDSVSIVSLYLDRNRNFEYYRVMYSNPHWRYTFTTAALNFAEALVRLHYIQPGAKVYLNYGKRQPQLIRCLDLPQEAIGNYAVWSTWWEEKWPSLRPSIEVGLDSVVVLVPNPIAAGVDDYLTSAGLMSVEDDNYVYCIDIQSYVPDNLVETRVDGIDVSSLFVRPDELVPGFVESLRPFQPSAIYHCSVNPYTLIVWACGAGKTRAAIGGALTRQGNILIIAPSRACYGWYREFKDVTSLDPYVCKSASKRRKKDIPLSQYMYGWKKDGRRRVVIAPLENIGAFSEELKRGGFTVLILDEIHEMGDPKRWTVTTDEGGQTTVERRTTAKKEEELESESDAVGANYKSSATDKLTRAVTLMDLSQLSTLRLRIGLSATPLGDGRHQRLWAPLDLLDPGGLGTFSEYKARYCLNDKEPINSFTGRLNDNGSSCKDELKHRSRFYLHEVTYSETHACMPPLTVRFVRLRIEDQNRPDAMKRQISAAERLLATVKGKGDEEEAAAKSLAQLRLAEASTTKRKYVIRESIEVLKGGGHVAIMTGQIKDTEKWAEEFAIELSKLSGEHEWAAQTQLFFGHGSLAQQGHELLGNVVDWGSDAEARAKMVREGYGGTYRHSPAVFIGTHQAFGASINGLEWTHRAFQVMLPWSGDDAVQVRGRWDRGGFPTLYDIIVSQNTYDERVQFIVMAKLGVATSYTKSEEARDMLKAANTFDSARINEEFNNMLLDEDALFDM